MSRLESLKALVMEQAAAKKFGTTPGDINVGEKLFLVGSEVKEIYDALGHHRGTFDEMATFGEEYAILKNDPQTLWEKGQHGLDVAIAVTTARNHYREEWADLLSRVVHLGGIFGITFADRYSIIPNGAPPIETVPPPWDSVRFLTLYNWIQDIGAHYRKKRIPEFEAHIPYLAAYILESGRREEFDVYHLALVKLEKNRTRVWDANTLNERFAK